MLFSGVGEGNLDPFLAKFLEVEGEDLSSDWPSKYQRYMEYIWIFHEYINRRDRILFEQLS